MLGWTNCRQVINFLNLKQDVSNINVIVLFIIYYTYLFSNKIYGDLVDWNTAKWEVSNMEEYETDYENICKPLALGLVMFPGHWNITQATNLCKNVRGEINVIRDAKNNEEMRSLMNKSDICRSSGKK